MAKVAARPEPPRYVLRLLHLPAHLSVTFQRKLLFGFSLMVLPALLVGAEAIRSNAARAPGARALGESMARTRTYAELETAMFDQSELIWRYLSGLDPTARKEFLLTGQVVDYWQDRWRGGAPARGDGAGGRGRRTSSARSSMVADSVFRLADAGRREEGYRLAAAGAQGPAAAGVDPDEPGDLPPGPGVERPGRVRPAGGDPGRRGPDARGHHRCSRSLAGLVASWLISRSLARPIRRADPGDGGRRRRRSRPPGPATSRDEIGDLARALAGMTRQPATSREQLVQAEKLASIGEMSAAVAHGLRNPLASLRAAAQLVRHHPTSPVATEHLDAIIEEVDRLDRRISHLLSFSRPAPFRPCPRACRG